MAIYEPPNYRELYEKQQKETDSWRNATELLRETLRDQFAMAAMQGIIANAATHKQIIERGNGLDAICDVTANAAYQYANAMMESRNK